MDRCHPEWLQHGSIGLASVPKDVILTCSPQKNLPTWATRRRSIPSVLRWSFFGPDSGGENALVWTPRWTLPYNCRFPNYRFLSRLSRFIAVIRKSLAPRACVAASAGEPPTVLRHLLLFQRVGETGGPRA